MDETLSFYGVSGDSGFVYSLLSFEGILQRYFPDVEFFFPRTGFLGAHVEEPFSLQIMQHEAFPRLHSSKPFHIPLEM